MDRFGGARYPAYTLRRFYPTMIGENLTYAPPQFQYGDPQRGTPQADFLSSVFEYATGLGKQYVEDRLQTSRTQREMRIEQERLDAEARRQQKSADAEARRISLQNLGRKSETPNYLPWVLGGLLGLGVLVVGGVAIASKK
jgi:hypothetical protein